MFWSKCNSLHPENIRTHDDQKNGTTNSCQIKTYTTLLLTQSSRSVRLYGDKERHGTALVPRASLFANLYNDTACVCNTRIVLGGISKPSPSRFDGNHYVRLCRPQELTRAHWTKPSVEIRRSLLSSIRSKLRKWASKRSEREQTKIATEKKHKNKKSDSRWAWGACQINKLKWNIFN